MPQWYGHKYTTLGDLLVRSSYQARVTSCKKNSERRVGDAGFTFYASLSLLALSPVVVGRL